MRCIFVMALLSAMSLSCGSAQNAAGSGKTDCEELAELAGVAAVLKWETKKTVESEEESDDMGWRMMGFVLNEDLEDMGFSPEESQEFMKKIYFTTILDNLEHDVLSHRMYAEISCRMRNEGGEPLGLEEAALSLHKCWLKDQELDSEICFEKVIKKELYYEGSEPSDAGSDEAPLENN